MGSSVIEWTTEAACAPAPFSVFFPPDGNYDQARAICAGCTVRAECLADALEAGDRGHHGMRAGLTPGERIAADHPEAGTVRGYQRHYRRGENACAPCKAANTAAQQERRCAK